MSIMRGIWARMRMQMQVQVQIDADGQSTAHVLYYLGNENDLHQWMMDDNFFPFSSQAKSLHIKQ